MNRPEKPHTSTQSDITVSAPVPSRLLATKFYAPIAPGKLIARPHLSALLDKSLERPFTLVEAPAGFGKTTLLSTWARSLQTHQALVAWISLDEEDNDQWLFWTCILAAFDAQRPQSFSSLLESLRLSQFLSLKSMLVALINLLAESSQRWVLILDDYQMIEQKQIHSTLAYLIECLPAQLRVIVSTRADPPLPLPQFRARQSVLEVRTEQLRCTTKETSTFFQEVIGIQLPEKIIQAITARTEGWLVGLQLLSFSLPAQADPPTIMQEVSGDQRYILDYLTEAVLQRQPEEVQTFLLFTSILEQLNTSLCDAVMQQHQSKPMLHQLEQANLFIVSLDSKRECYRYHALFAEALHYLLEQRHADLVPILHHRASLWYAEHDQTSQAVLHAFKAHEWQLAADLIEHKYLQLMARTWGASHQQLIMFQHWLEQLPAEVLDCRPRLCLAYSHLLWIVAPYSRLNNWFEAAETKLTASLTQQIPGEISQALLSPQALQEHKNLLGEVLVWRATLHATWKDHGQSIPKLCQQALSLLSAENAIAHAYVALAQMQAHYSSTTNDAMLAIESGLQGAKLAKTAEQPALSILLQGLTALYTIGTGQLHDAQQLTQQAMQPGRTATEFTLLGTGYPAAIQAEILREWDQLEAAHSLVVEAISLSEQMASTSTSPYIFWGYAVLLRISLSYGDLEAAHSALQQIENITSSWNQPMSQHFRSLFSSMDQVRLWLACGEMDRALRWAKMLDMAEYQGTPLAHEREEVARVRVLLAAGQSSLSLERLESVLKRASDGKRWGHVIEIRLLQALAYYMCQEEMQALNALSEAVRLGEPEGYTRTFVDEGPPMKALLSELQEQQRKYKPTPYLDKLLAAFPQQSKAQEHQPKRVGEHTKTQQQFNLLSEREIQVLHLLSQGSSNQEIAQKLTIALDTVKRHVSHIFSKLGVNNRVQALRLAQELDLLNRKS